MAESSVLPWNNWAPNTVNIFMLQASHDRIPTRDLLTSRGIILPSLTCKLCGEEEESVEHLFLTCRVAATIWSKVSNWCRIQPIYAFSFKDLMEVPSSIRSDKYFKKAIHVMIMATVWNLWKHRNKVTFERASPSVNAVFFETVADSSLWMRARSKNKAPSSLLEFMFDPG